MATTTNYSWTTPDDTALVKDGASAIRSLGTAIDTTTKNLNPSTTLGDIEYRSSTANTNTRLGIGTSGQGLQVVAGVPSWAASSTSTLTTTGDLLYASAANTLARRAIGTTGQVLTVAGGVPSWATLASGSTFAGCSLYKSANQSFSSGSGINATFDTELFDTDGYHSTSSNTDRITIPSGKAGYYLITGRATWNYSSTGQRIGTIRKNAGATQLAQQTQINMSSNYFTSLTVQIIANLAVGDYVVFENYQDGTGSLDLLGGTQIWTTFSAAYLGA